MRQFFAAAVLLATVPLMTAQAPFPGPGPCPLPRPRPGPKPDDPVPHPKKNSWVNGVSHQGVNINCDLPNDQQIKNVGSKLDGAGMCVFTSIEMAARYQNIEGMRGWRDWCAANYRGGGYPQKVDQLLAAWWKAKGIAPIPYLQFEGADPDALMSVIDRTNRMACVTYGYSPRYGSTIAHMVCAILYRKDYAVVLDNNFIGDNRYEWMSRAELVRRMKHVQGSAWVFVWLTPGSPPPPKWRVS